MGVFNCSGHPPAVRFANDVSILPQWSCPAIPPEVSPIAGCAQ